MASYLGIFKLEKLKIKGFTDNNRQIPATSEPFEAMFNPASYSQTKVAKWQCRQPANSSGAELEYIATRPSELRFTLLLDDMGVDEMGILWLKHVSIFDRIKSFETTCYKYQGSIHQPNFLIVHWGSLLFDCRLSSATTKYTLFDRDGFPLRAEISAVFISDMEVKSRLKAEGKESPDLTHARVVRRGDTLPLLVKEVYGSADAYLDVARYNHLDDFRNLRPGQQLLFPPLATFKAKAKGKDSDSGKAGGKDNSQGKSSALVKRS